MNRLFRYLFLAKEIKSKSGELHFQRWRIVWTPLFAIYIHYIAKSDEDKHPHNHPWNFYSFILYGGYKETLTKETSFAQYAMSIIFKIPCPSYTTTVDTFKQFSFISRDRLWFHKISLLKPTWTLVFTGKNYKDWGYLVDNQHVNFEEYRKNKNEGKYNDC